MSHPAIPIHLKNGGSAYVDVEIVELISALNDLGWNTHMSCQDNVENRVWISFYHSNFAASFMELIAKKSSLRKKVLEATTQRYDHVPNRHKVKNRWWIDAYTSNIGGHGPHWTGDICIRISIRFPRKHLKEVTKIVVKERNKQAKKKGA